MRAVRVKTGISIAVIAATLFGVVALEAAPKKTASLNAAPNKSTSAAVGPKPKLWAPKGCPAGMAPIPSDTGGFCIDRYEAALLEVLPNGKTKNHSPYEPVG